MVSVASFISVVKVTCFVPSVGKTQVSMQAFLKLVLVV